MSEPGNLCREVTIQNNKGLHARASALFVKCAERYDAEISVSRGGETVGGTSIMGLMMLAAAKGSTIVIEAKGAEAEQALQELISLVNEKFHEGS